MKAIALSSAVLTLFLAGSASANLALPQMEVHSQLAHEEVTIKISGDQAEVTGTFKFTKTGKDYYDLSLYLPVYAKEGATLKEFKPDIAMGDHQLEVHFVDQKWQPDFKIKNFGELPQLEGQKVHWFMVSHLPQQPKQKDYTLKIRYTQKLSGGKFIYTPLIPKQKKGVDYGSITVEADQPLTLQNADQHSFVKEGDKLVVEPSDKIAIVVSVAKPEKKLP